MPEQSTTSKMATSNQQSPNMAAADSVKAHMSPWAPDGSNPGSGDEEALEVHEGAEDGIPAETRAPVCWDRVETDFCDETQKFSVTGLHRAQTLFSIHPSSPAFARPVVSSCSAGNTVLLCVDNILHISAEGEHVAAVELDCVAEHIVLLDTTRRLAVLARNDGELEILDTAGNSLFSFQLTQVDADTSAGDSDCGQTPFLFLEAANDSLCLLTRDLTLHVLRKKRHETPTTNGHHVEGDHTQAMDLGESQDNDKGSCSDTTNGDRLDSDDISMIEDEPDASNSCRKTNEGSNVPEVRQKNNTTSKMPFLDLLDISSFRLPEHADVSDVAALVMVEDMVVFSSGTDGALYRLDIADGSVVKLSAGFLGGRISKILASGDKRYLVLLSVEGYVATMCLRTFLLVDFITNLTFSDIALAQTADDDGEHVVKVQLVGYHKADKKISVYRLPTVQEEYSVAMEGHVSLVKQCTPSEELIVVAINDDLSSITVKSINEGSPETKLEILLLKKKYEEAEQLAKLFKLPLQDVYLEEFYSLLNKLGPNGSNVNEADNTFEHLLELYDKLNSPVEVYQAVINSLPASLDHTLRLLERLAKDLQQNQNGNGSSSQLADVVLAQYKLTTFKLIESEPHAALWNSFIKKPTLDLVVESLQHYQNARALVIWSRHRDMICGSCDLNAIRNLLSALPVEVSEMKKWLTEGRLFTYVTGDFPDALDDLITKVVESACASEVRDPTSWPLSALDLLDVFQNELDSMLNSKSEENFSLPVVLNAMKLFQNLKKDDSAVSKMAALRKDIRFLIELRQKYNVRLPLSELSSMQEKDLMFFVLNQLHTEKEIHSFIHGTLKDSCLKKGSDLNNMLLDYIAQLRTLAEASDGAEWELKACRVFKLLAIPEFMSKAALIIIEAAVIPWKHCVHEVYDIAVGMDFLHREKLERLKKDIPLKLILRKHAVPPGDLGEEDVIGLLINAGESLEDLLSVFEEVGWTRVTILVEFLLKYCEDEDANRVEKLLQDYHEELRDNVVWAKLQCIVDTTGAQGTHAALLRHALRFCNPDASRQITQADSMSQILTKLQGQTSDEVYSELYIYSYAHCCKVEDILYDLLVEAARKADAKLPLIAACFLQQEVNERVCLLALQYLLSTCPVVEINHTLEKMVAKCNFQDGGYSLYMLWVSCLAHFGLTSSNDPFICWKFSADFSAQNVTIPSSVIASVNKLVNNVFDDSTREMAVESWLEKVVAGTRQCYEDLQRVPAVHLAYELLLCVGHTLEFFELNKPTSLAKLATESAKSFIREHIASKYGDLFVIAHVLAELGPELLVQHFQSMLAHSLSNTTMVSKVASVGLLVCDMLQLPGKSQLSGTLRASEWCLRLADYQVDVKKIVKEGFNQRNADDVAEKLTRSINVNIDLLKQFAQDFSLGSLNVHASRLLQTVLLSAVEEVHKGNAQAVYLELLPKADNILSLLTPDEVRASLLSALPLVDDYCYEILQYVYDHLENLGHDQSKELNLLFFLKGYQRESKISTKESLQWTMLHPEYCTLPDTSLKRIPLRIIMDKPEVVLTAELNSTNIDNWISVCELISGLSPDDMRVLALSNAVKQYKQRASAFSCDQTFVEFFMKLINDMRDEKKALSSALHMFNELPKGKTKVQIAHDMWRYASDCLPMMNKFAQTFHSQYRALGCEVILRENSFDESALLKRCIDPHELVATILRSKLNSAISLDAVRVLPVVEQTAALANIKTKDFLAHFVKKWLGDGQTKELQNDVTAAFNFNQIMNGIGGDLSPASLSLDEVIRVVRLLVALPEETAVQIVSCIVALQNNTQALASAEQQLRTNMAVLCAFDEQTASSLLGAPTKTLVQQCNQLVYAGRIQRHGVTLTTFLTSDEQVSDAIGQLVQRNQRDSLVLAFHMFRDFGVRDERTLTTIVDGVAGRPDILEEAVLFLQRFRSAFGQPEFLQCWTRVVVVHTPASLLLSSATTGRPADL